MENDGRARQIQRQMELSKALRDGVKSWVGLTKTTKHPTSSYPNNSNNNNWRSNNTGGKSNGNQELNNRHQSGAKTSEEQGNRWR